MSYSWQFGDTIGQKLQTADASVRALNTNVSTQLTDATSQVKDSIRAIDPTQGSKYYQYLNKVQETLHTGAQLLNTSNDQIRLAKIKSWSSLEDMLAPIGVFLLVGGLVLAAYLRKR